ncbi:MAG: carotenoid biosynthesis protein [Williamsia sp.]|nr:carotenoid biosynthesis protein [Williamsia sp.]
MPPYHDMPYGPASAYCFPLFEFSLYALFVFCLVHAFRKGWSHVFYLLGGLLFGLILEYVNVVSNMGYVYGQFLVMFGKAPLNIPLCIGVGWSVIMYSSRLFTDAFRLPLWTSAALDTLLAISIDLSMDTVAYRLHMWHWNWAGTGLNPLTAEWFGIPFGNFFGWLMVVFFYSSFSRLLERAFGVWPQQTAWKAAAAPLLAVILSQAALYVMLVYVDQFLYTYLGITSLHRFVAFMVVLLLLVAARYYRIKGVQTLQLPAVSWLVPVWFHLFFFTWLFAGKFYAESPWLVAAACLNLLIGVYIHAPAIWAKSEAELPVTALQ